MCPQMNQKYTAFVVENGKMVMETDLDMNGYSINVLTLSVIILYQFH